MQSPWGKIANSGPKMGPGVISQGSKVLYRVVQPAELADTQKTGVFRNLGYAEGKYFTTCY